MPRGSYLKEKARLRKILIDMGHDTDWRGNTLNDYRRLVLERSDRRFLYSRMEATAPRDRHVTPLTAPRVSKNVTKSGSQYYSRNFQANDLNDVYDVINRGTRPIKPDAHVRIEVRDSTGSKVIGTPIKRRDEAVADITDKVEQMDANYSNYTVSNVVITTVKATNINGQGGRSYKIHHKTWKVVEINTLTNCAYTAAQVCIDLNYDDSTVEKARELKRRVNSSNKSSADESVLCEIANQVKRNILVYNSSFEVISRIESNRKVGRGTKGRDDIEIMYKNNHFQPMLRYSRLGVDPPEEVEPLIECKHANNLKVCEVIKSKKIHQAPEFKVITWDIETSTLPNGRIKAYGVGFYDGEYYGCYWGLDCLQQFACWLRMNIEVYAGYHLYAHNSGKFDAIQLLQEAILTEDSHWNVATVQNANVELNGRWLQITLNPKCEDGSFLQGMCIYLNDSFPLLPGSLESLTNDFDVEHKKLTETVSHDEITLDNFREFPQLDAYLKNDVIGLYEVLEKFNSIIWDMTRITWSSKEKKVVNCIEAFTGHTFERNVRKEFLRVKKEGKRSYPLELDGYCAELKLAIEYNGKQHYEKVAHLHNKTTLEEIQVNDQLKNEICEKNGIRLITIKYNCFDYEEVICKYLKKYGIPFNKNAEYDKDAKVPERVINITSCLTAASLSKRLFKEKFYKPDKMPVCTLTRDIDKYIRDGYRGGRVEVFHLGKVPCDHFYYYDYTSLYPSVMLEDLPYGIPEYRDIITMNDIIEGKFYGVCKARVSSIDNKKKPLHAVVYDNKLTFPYLSSEVLTLYSDEILLGYRQGLYNYELIDGYHFQRGKVCKGFVDGIYDKKKNADIKGNSAEKKVWKIILNSGYGFWGLRTEDRDGVTIYEQGKAPISRLIEEGRLISEADIGNYTMVRKLSDLPMKDFNVAIATAITSLARMKLWTLINDIESKGEKVYMCDTDSVITSMNLDKYPDIKKKHMPDNCGKALGSLKSEANDEFKKDPIKNGILGFDKCILGGAKFYALKSTEYDKEICKCKGYNAKQKGCKLTFDMFEKQVEDFGISKPSKEVSHITQSQLQFRSGLGSYVRQFNVEFDSVPFEIKKTYVTKNIFFDYSKGVVHEDGSITPLTI